MLDRSSDSYPYEPIEDSQQARATPIDVAVATLQVVARVLLVIAVWLVLCFSVFLGFFTIPLLMLMAFSFIFVIFDLRKVLRRRAEENRRKAEDNDAGNRGG